MCIVKKLSQICMTPKCAWCPRGWVGLDDLCIMSLSRNILVDSYMLSLGVFIQAELYVLDTIILENYFNKYCMLMMVAVMVS